MPRASGMFKSDIAPLGFDLYVCMLKEAAITSCSGPYLQLRYSNTAVLHNCILTYFLYVTINMDFGLQKYYKNNCY